MATALFIGAAVFLIWHVSTGIGKGKGMFAAALLLFVVSTGRAEWTAAQVELHLENQAAANQWAESQTAIAGYAVGLFAAYFLLNRIRL